ncbi:MAG: CHASE2 domain-containing protein [Nostocales cyanobacterium]|nr:MAG: CHASE2 domain-containing protein [Nostocales cyanobacterium]TAF18455.1 MAG: CHASE2 domain-containing protein [Nostocales cyanobacterium]
MAEEPRYSLTNKNLSTAKNQLSRLTKINLTGSLQQPKTMVSFGHVLAGTSAVAAALLSATSGNLVQLIENQAATSFYQIRGAKVAPQDIVILAIDDQSITTPEQYYQTNSQQYQHLKPLQSFPYQRLAYAQVIEKLINAGARSVAVDIVFDKPSGYGKADDLQLQKVLQKYGSKITLAAVYEDFKSHQGEFQQFTQPLEQFRQTSALIGSVNFPIEVDGKIHRLSSAFLPEKATAELINTKPLSFGEAVLAASQINYPRPRGDRIYFWGKEQAFTTVPFWYVFDQENWNNYLQQGKFFQNKIVLIGATAKLSNDFHAVAVSPHETMAGVEIHAQAIATLIADKSIAIAIKNPLLRGLFVLVLVSSTILIITRKRPGLQRLLLSIALASLWGGISYSSYMYAYLIIPTTVPIIGILLTGLSYFSTEIAKDKINKQKLLLLFQKHKLSSVVQEIISQQDELKDLIQKRDLELNGKILGGRYKISKVLGAGGFSETYIAEDIQIPEHPECVVKQLKPATSKPENLALARRLFSAEAKTLQRLGIHSQIPQLLAYFEEDEEFYLVQEYILGHDLGKELVSGKCLPERAVIAILKDILNVLRFIHENGVIHRDIKPGNIIRRHSDWKLVLIDFGAVKEMSTQIMDNLESTAFTIGIGTKGYAPNEQCFGRPRYNSDIYAVGMLGIKALTGISPHELKRASYDAEVQWMDQATVSEELAAIINKMVLEDHKQRYHSTLEVLEDLNKLPTFEDITASIERNYPPEDPSSVDPDAPTSPWPQDI